MRLWTLAVLASIAPVPDSHYWSARRKVDLIENDRATPRSSLFFNLQESNSYARVETYKAVGDAVRNPRVTFRSGTATGMALVDFAKLSAAKGRPPGKLLGWILKGEREVSVELRIASAEGKARVDVHRVEVSGIPISGAALNWLIENYLVPRYPDITIGKPFELRHGVERVDVSGSGVNVRMKG